MRFLSAAALLAGIMMEQAAACVTAHTYMENHLIKGDTMTLQLFFNGNSVCRGAKTLTGASRDTQYYFDETNGCQPGWHAWVRDNGETVEIYAPNSYWTVLKNRGRHMNKKDCSGAGKGGGGGFGVRRGLQCLEFESVHMDENTDCAGQPVPQLCDFIATC